MFFVFLISIPTPFFSRKLFGPTLFQTHMLFIQVVETSVVAALGSHDVVAAFTAHSAAFS